MAVILTIIGVALLILIGWMWTSLGNIETKTKLISMTIGLIVVYIITFIIFNISKMGIQYDDETVMKTVRRVFVGVFTIINGYIILPYSFRRLEQINNDELTREKLQRSIIIVLIMIVILFIFESIYLGNIQQGIIDLMNK